MSTLTVLRTRRGRGLRIHPTRTTTPIPRTRSFASSTRTEQSESSGRRPLFQRLASAWNDTPTKWYPLPLGAGAVLLLGMHIRKSWTGSAMGEGDTLGKEVHVDENGREIVRLKGPWQVHVLGALPLRNISRLWGWANGLELPVWFRPFGFKLYARIFGCNLDEMKEQDLTAYKSLGEFFYRELAPGLRPVAAAPLVSPADGTVLHFGQVTDFRVEQVKGLTYSLDALLGADPPPAPPNSPAGSGTSTPTEGTPDMDVVAHQDFANVNGIEYSLGQLLGSSGPATPADTALAPRHSHAGDVSVQDTPLPEALAHDAGVAADMGAGPALARRRSWSGERGLRTGPDTALFFAVVYLAPGDYHRFHSPAAWVVERRRHFFGELFSVSPFLARRLEGLFVLNERVALLGRWRHGFFGMVPVGATNVGGIKINFDQHLRTNERGPRPPPGTYTEATYGGASAVLGGQPLAQAEEMGGFFLGSTIVLVFEAPRDWAWDIEPGMKVKVGEALGHVRE